MSAGYAAVPARQKHELHDPVAPTFANPFRVRPFTNTHLPGPTRRGTPKSGFQHGPEVASGFWHLFAPQTRTEAYTRTNNPGFDIYLPPKSHGRGNGRLQNGIGGGHSALDLNEGAQTPPCRDLPEAILLCQEWSRARETASSAFWDEGSGNGFLRVVG